MATYINKTTGAAVNPSNPLTERMYERNPLYGKVQQGIDNRAANHEPDGKQAAEPPPPLAKPKRGAQR